MPSMDQNTDVIQGTLDLLILKAVSLDAMHGWGISQRIQDSSRLQAILAKHISLANMLSPLLTGQRRPPEMYSVSPVTHAESGEAR